ncbi:MAG TPA: hypothetical protein VN420_05275 [Candidatus Fimivivens sp.]|nr:hypothetical protein [Candidatus Fimivivens sp.]
MRVLFVSGEMIAGDVAYRLRNEGCDVRLFIGDESRKDCFDNMVEKTDDWRKELEWVGKDGLIVFDDVGYGKEQDELRRNGFTVFGGCEKGDELEQDREFGQKVFESCGMEIAESKNFDNFDDAIEFIGNNRARWVVKQNSHDGALSYVGMADDGNDVISVIKSYKKFNKSSAISTITLQKRIDGVEIAIARFFNGADWNGPIFVSFEHKPFLHGDLGPLTAEMGTLAWYDYDEDNKVFRETLHRLKPYLQRIGYRGYVDINSIIDRERLIPLEATMRFGSPTNHMQSDMHVSSWADILRSTATGEMTDFRTREGYSVVVSIAIPPFPYKPSDSDNSYYLKDVDILFKETLSENEWRRIHFEEISKRVKADQYYIAGSNGYSLFVSGSGTSVEEARKDAYALVGKVIVPKMMYRTDIGVKFVEKDRELLKEWGWIVR